jgi:predicted MPP superfamily phosphohydrolase
MFFLLLVTVVSFAVNRYLWRRLVRDPRLSRRASRIGSAALLALAASAPLTVVGWSMFSRVKMAPLNALSFSWLGLSFYLVLLLAAWDLVRVGLWAAGKLPRRAAAAPASPLMAAETTRRVFVARSAAAGALLASGGIGAWGVRSALWDITMPEVEVKLPRFPRALDGYTIALMTDVHIGPLLDGKFLRQLAEKVNGVRPDMIAIAGDLVDGHVRRIGAQVAELRRMQSRDGTYFVTGNHEYYSHAADWIEFLPKLGLHVLLNEHLTITPGRSAPNGSASFDLAGVPDQRAAAYSGNVGPDPQLAVKGRDDQRELIMLAHQPVQVIRNSEAGVGLQLSGHTHGGQLMPFGMIAAIAQPYVAGLHRHTPDTQIYVSRGTGFWGPPMRVMAPAEVTVLRLSAG